VTGGKSFEGPKVFFVDPLQEELAQESFPQSSSRVPSSAFEKRCHCVNLDSSSQHPRERRIAGKGDRNTFSFFTERKGYLFEEKSLSLIFGRNHTSVQRLPVPPVSQGEVFFQGERIISGAKLGFFSGGIFELEKVTPEERSIPERNKGSCYP